MPDNHNDITADGRIYIPTATYRIQFNHTFPFAEARRHADYFQRLGVSDIYSSPIWKATPGSLHCYDVTDQSEINPELGGEEELNKLSAALRERNLGLVVDLVPNHMGVVHPDNRQWWDVLENGPGSRFADFFDIDWRTDKEVLHNRVELPTLGSQFGICLENGELQVSFTDDCDFLVHYYDTVLPTGPRTWVCLLNLALERLREQLEPENDDLLELESITSALGNLPSRDADTPGQAHERQREKDICKRRLCDLIEKNPAVGEILQQTVTQVNGTPGDPASFDILEQFLESQTYRLCFWRVAGDEINYRRFFDVNQLAAIRVELPHVFHQVHELIFRLIREGHIRGLRIDHPDGLLNPAQYFSDLQNGCLEALAQRYPDRFAPETRATTKPTAMWVVAEKILEHHERIRPDWAVHGTTGYDLLNLINGVFVDRSHNPAFLRLYSKFVGSGPNFTELRTTCKKLILEVSMAGELYTLAGKLDRISEHNRRTRDFTMQSLQEALAEFIAAFPVYRSYIQPDATTVDSDDRHYIDHAIRTAKRRNPSTDPTIFDFIGSILLLEDLDSLTPEQRDARMEFILALQQTTGPVMAKGLEDTAFYREFPLASLNEVGGDPDRFGVSVAEFHSRCEEQAQHWPYSMIATSTHDTKRSEDVRARINVLSEIPPQWERTIYRWRRMNSRRKTQVDGHHVPTTKDEYLFYQTLLGIWPVAPAPEGEGDLTQRMVDYMIKATREAKQITSWVKVNEEFETALTDFVQKTLDPARSSKFLADFGAFVDQIAMPGAINSLAQVLIKLTAPGIPDMYQGTELWDFSLVDPDNRRPVDYELRKRILEEVIQRQNESAYLEELQEHWRDGRIKMFVTHKGLAFRRAHEQLFREGTYVPLAVEGPGADHVLAFAQTLPEKPWAITIVPRLLTSGGFPGDQLADAAFWTDTSIRLPEHAAVRWHNIFTGEGTEASEGMLAVAPHLGRFPVALLVSE